MTGTAQHATRRRRLLALVTGVACSVATIASAEVQVEGTAAAVRVTTSQAAISDVLSAFAAPFNVKYRTAVPLNTAANDVYAGSFGQVIGRLLEGYNYVVKKDQETIEVVIFGRHGEVAVPAPAPKAPAPNGFLSRWR